MTSIFNEAKDLQPSPHWQTKQRGKLEDEYQIYRTLADDGTGHDIATGAPLLTFDEWLQK